MRSFSKLAGRERLIELVRWFCVLPAAVLGDCAVSFLVRAVVQIVRAGGSGILGDSSLAFWFGVLLSYGPPKAAFVIAGAKMAPRQQVASSIVLTMLGLGLSLMTHI